MCSCCSNLLAEVPLKMNRRKKISTTRLVFRLNGSVMFSCAWEMIVQSKFRVSDSLYRDQTLQCCDLIFMFAKCSFIKLYVFAVLHYFFKMCCSIVLLEKNSLLLMNFKECLFEKWSFQENCSILQRTWRKGTTFSFAEVLYCNLCT